MKCVHQDRDLVRAQLPDRLDVTSQPIDPFGTHGERGSGPLPGPVLSFFQGLLQRVDVLVDLLILPPIQHADANYDERRDRKENVRRDEAFGVCALFARLRGVIPATTRIPLSERPREEIRDRETHMNQPLSQVAQNGPKYPSLQYSACPSPSPPLQAWSSEQG